MRTCYAGTDHGRVGDLARGALLDLRGQARGVRDRHSAEPPLSRRFVVVSCSPMRRVVVIALLVAASAFGQRAIDLKGSVGMTVFSEDDERHFLSGASARFYLTRRLSVEPEFQYLYLSSQHYDLGFVPNVVFDFGGERVVPYVTGGVGLMYTRHDFGHFVSGGTDLFVTLGGGVKVYVTDNWFVAPDVRFGFVPHLRFSAGLGYTWRR